MERQLVRRPFRQFRQFHDNTNLKHHFTSILLIFYINLQIRQGRQNFRFVLVYTPVKLMMLAGYRILTPSCIGEFLEF